MAIVDVIKHNSSADIFAWKYPNDELGTWTQLVVNESQEAILFKGGQAQDTFTSGTYTLSTRNIPILNNIINLPFGGKSPFKAEVWFINKVHSLDIKWGTKNPIQLQDPKYKIIVPVRSFGQFGIQIEDSRKFLTKLVGTMDVFDSSSIKRYFRGLFITQVKDIISTYLVKKKISVVEISAYLEEISRYALLKVTKEMDEYGIKILNFYVNSINFPENDEGVIRLKNALAKRAEMDIVGYDYSQERSFNTLEGAAKNEGSMASNLMGATMGIGMGASITGGLAAPMRSVTQNLNTSTSQKQCHNCNTLVDQNQRFCGFCGESLTKNVQKEEHKYILCNKCGNKIREGSNFCEHCGDVYNPCPNCNADLMRDAQKCPECGYILPKKCPSCNSKVKHDAKFCSNCGLSMVTKCKECDVELAEGARFCSKCGTKVI